MAELVNQRIEDTINELEQMRRTNLYEEDEIREIARKRKDFEYRIQRRQKSKDDYVHYVVYELALLEDIALRRKQAKTGEKRKEIEYAITKRLNKIFKQFIYRFQDDIEVYFQYIKFCISVGFSQAVSGIITQMLQIHGDKPSTWLLASKWESEEQNQPANGRNYLLKGIHRHPESELLYLELFKIELLLAFNTEDNEEKDKQIKRANVIWKNALKQTNNVKILFKMLDMALAYDFSSITDEIKETIWSFNSQKEVWSFIANKELEGCHWDAIEEFVNDDYDYPKVVKHFMAAYEEAMQQFPDENLCTEYIHKALGLSEDIVTKEQKVAIVKSAWMYGHENGMLSNDMYEFGLKMLKIENETSEEQMIEIIDAAITKNPKARSLWQEKMLMSGDDKKMLQVLQECSKKLIADDQVHLWNIMLDRVESSETIKLVYKKIQNCESVVVLTVKPKLLQKMYEHCGLKSARQLYEEFIRTPPIQMDVHTKMIDIEQEQATPSTKHVRKCYECLIQHCGVDNIKIWSDYIQLESQKGSAHLAPAVYRRAIATLKKELVDEFIKNQTLSKIN